MNPEQFVAAVRKQVVEASVNGMLKTLRNPPGRNPARAVKERAVWFNALGDKDKQMLSSVIAESVETAVFGFLCVLDGVRVIEDSTNKGVLKLLYERDEFSTTLNPPDGELLHDLL